MKLSDPGEPIPTGDRLTPAPEDQREKGVRCPKCHCRHCPVLFVRHAGSVTIRKRKCRYSGKMFTERAVVVPEDEGGDR